MPTIAVLIPCFNEALTVGQVVRDFRAALPDAAIYVFDNNSTDDTAGEARRAGAIVRSEPRQGKGNVVRAMFRQVTADIYVMVDGDGTYSADRVHDLIRPISTGAAEMAVGSRLHPGARSRFSRLKLAGNRFFLFILNTLFRMNITDVLSGYRALSRHAVAHLPVLSRGFEVEAELTIKCFERGYRIIEVPVDLSPRRHGSTSKIHVVRDGLLILATIFSLSRDYKPLTVFGSVGALLFLSGLAVTLSMLRGDAGASTQLLHATLGGCLILSGFLSVSVGLVLHSIARRFQEQHQLLQNQPPHNDGNG